MTHFTLTGPNGERYHACCCLVVFEDASVSGDGSGGSGSGDLRSKANGWADRGIDRPSARALVILSHTPFVVTARESLHAIVSSIHPSRHSPSSIGGASLSDSGSNNGSTSSTDFMDLSDEDIAVCKTTLTTVARAQRGMADTITTVTSGNFPATCLRPLDFHLVALFTTLRPLAIVRILKALLIERKVLFVGQSSSLLTSIAEGFRALMSPLSWCHVYAPVVPESMQANLDCPTPYIMGVLSTPRRPVVGQDGGSGRGAGVRGGYADIAAATLERARAADVGIEGSGGLVVVRLDTGQIEVSQGASAGEEGAVGEVEGERGLDGGLVALAADLQDTMWGQYMCSDDMSSSLSSVSSVASAEEGGEGCNRGRGHREANASISVALRRCVCTFMRTLLHGANDYCVRMNLVPESSPGGRGGPSVSGGKSSSPVIVFDEVGFARSRGPGLKALASQLVLTSHFSQFLTGASNGNILSLHAENGRQL